jgi:hypothetical protein
MEHEKWKTVFDGRYEVSTLGRIKRLRGGRGAKKGKLLKPVMTYSEKDRNGNPRQYAKVAISFGGGWVKHVMLHRLVAETFIGPCPKGWCVNHRDGDKLNNALSNLEYVTNKGNAEHASLMGLLVRGEDHQHAKVTEVDVVAIRRAVHAGVT